MVTKMDEDEILNSVVEFGAIDEERVWSAIVDREPIHEWLERSFPSSEKYGVSKAENERFNKYYPPELSGSIDWDQNRRTGRFRLRQKTLILDSYLRYRWKEEERYGVIVLEGPRPVSLSLTYSKNSVGFQFGLEVGVTIRMPETKPDDSPGWSAFKNRAPLWESYQDTQEVSVPYDLIDSWRNGELGSSSHEIAWKSDQWIDYGELRYLYGLYRWFHALGKDPLTVLQRAGFMDQDTLRLMKASLEEPVSIIRKVLIREKDRERLGTLAKVEREAQPLSYLQLARLLGYGSKGGGCHNFVRRMQEQGLIEVKEGPGGSGVLIRLTPTGMSVL
jgi:hypothetical protein